MWIKGAVTVLVLTLKEKWTKGHYSPADSSNAVLIKQNVFLCCIESLDKAVRFPIYM